jgi:hypothetical protein
VIVEVVEPFATIEVLEAVIVEVPTTAAPGVTEIDADSTLVKLPELKVSL